MRKSWTEGEIRVLTRVAYMPVLKAELAGEPVVKAEYLRRAETALPGRTHHTCKDRCYRISEVLRDEGYPYVGGWRPPDEVGQTSNSPGVTLIIRRAVLPIARAELDPSSRG